MIENDENEDYGTQVMIAMNLITLGSIYGTDNINDNLNKINAEESIIHKLENNVNSESINEEHSNLANNENTIFQNSCGYGFTIYVG